MSNYFESGRYSLSPKKIYIHDDWNPHTTQYDGDLSLLEFEEGSILYSTFVQPICLWGPKNEPGETEGIVCGWVWSNDRAKKHLTEPKRVNIPIQGDDICLPGKPELAGSVDFSSDRTCLRNGTVLCQGDSGGVLFFKVGGVYHLKGIASSSLLSGEDCDVSKNAVYTNVLKFKDWINTITGNVLISSTIQPLTTSTQRTKFFTSTSTMRNPTQSRATKNKVIGTSTRSETTTQLPEKSKLT